jgi:uncharacterized caspase-like protein
MKRFLLVLFLMTAALAFGQQKYALVIGNAAYPSDKILNNPVNDANDMASTLRELGFAVEKVLNGSLEEMEKAVDQLKSRLSMSNNSYGFFFYAGHGVQSNGENYLIPVDANIPAESYLRNRAVSVQAILSELNKAGNILNIVVLDSCRDNPFVWSRGGDRGMSTVTHQYADSIIVYATSAGSKSIDGIGKNGLFTTHLLNNLRKPGLEVKEVFHRTGADVSQASDRAQIPAIYDQFFGTAYLGTKPSPNPNPPTIVLKLISRDYYI